MSSSQNPQAGRQIRHIGSAEAFAAAFRVSRETLGRLKAYESLLRQWQPAVNLVAPSTLTDVWHRHFADSAQLLRYFPEGAGSHLDAGSGGGFPGLVLAILRAGASSDKQGTAGAASGPARPPRTTLVEADTRKAAFLREVSRQLGMPVDILSIRLEKLTTHTTVGTVDVVTARALAPLNRLLEYTAPLFAPHTVGVFPKGREVEAEIEAARVTWELGHELFPSLTDPQGSILVVRRPRCVGPRPAKA